MRFEDITIINYESNDFGGDFEVPSTEDLIDAMNKVREEKGYTDIVKWGVDNPIYYNFYLVLTYSNGLELTGVCHYGEKDDFVDYVIPVTLEEHKMLAKKVFDALMKEIANA